MPSLNFFNNTQAKRFTPYGRAAMRQEQPEEEDIFGEPASQQSAFLTFVKKSVSWLWAEREVVAVETTTATDEERGLNKNGK
ncbi:hypothetical protein BGZ58_006247, partial [Dissophora ornata]